MVNKYQNLIREVKPVYGGKIGLFNTTVDEVFRSQKFALSEKTVRALIHNHGSEYGRVIDLIAEKPELKESLNNSHVIKAEIINAVRNEMALRLADVVFRRTDLGTAGDISDKAVRECANIMAHELNWSNSRIENEMNHTQNIFSKLGSIKNYESKFVTDESN